MYLICGWSNKKVVCVFLSTRKFCRIVLLGVRSWKRWANKKVYFTLETWGVLEYDGETEEVNTLWGYTDSQNSRESGYIVRGEG